MHYVLKTGTCTECGVSFHGLISEDPSKNLCTLHRPSPQIAKYRSIRFRTPFSPHFDRGLNEFVSSERERQRFIKDQGLIEVGNELDYLKEADVYDPLVTEEQFVEKVKEVEQRFPNYDASDAPDSS